MQAAIQLTRSQQLATRARVDRLTPEPPGMSALSVERPQTRRPRRCSLATGIFCCALIVTCLAAIRNNVADPDLWGHVQYGREVLTSAELPVQATWTFTSSGFWINHENIAELILASVSDLAGATGLGLMKLLITLAILGLMMRQAISRRASLPAVAIVLILACECMQFHWHFRPHLFGFLLFSVLIALLDWVFQNWKADWNYVRRQWYDEGHNESISDEHETLLPLPTRPDAAVARLRWLWLGPPILCLWTNTHGGFAAGLAVWCTYLTLRIIEAWCSWGITVLPLMKRLAMMLVAGILATLVNPYGPTLHLWLAADVGLPRPEITDWQPLISFGAEMWAFWGLLGLTAISFAKSRRHFSLTETVLLALITWQALSHVRHALFFAVLCGFWLPHRLSDTLRSLLPNHRTLAEHWHQSRARIACAALAAVVAVILAIPVGQSFSTVVVDRARYPVSAMNYVKEKSLYGRTVVAFNWAQYAIGCFGADPEASGLAEVALDGRLRTCYPQPIIDVYLDLFLGQQDEDERYRSPDSPDYDPVLGLHLGDPEVLIVERNNPFIQGAISRERQDWTLLYQDQIAQVWGRREIYDDVRSPDFVPVALRRITNQPQTGLVQWPAIPGTAAKPDSSMQSTGGNYQTTIASASN